MQNKKPILFMATALMVGVLAGCGPTTTSDGSEGPQNVRIDFWTGFGGAVNAVLEPMLAEFEEANPHIDVVYETKGGYPNLKQAIDLSVGNTAYPHIANGYPDHFASYLNSNIMLPLDAYMADAENGVVEEDFYADYMNENQELVEGVTVGLPFNKSTEIMVANKSFFEVMASHDATVKVPETWDELATIGAKIKQITEAQGYFGKVVVRKDGGGFEAVSRPDEPTVAEKAAFAEKTMFDFTEVTKEKFIPFNWDSTSNFFITMVRQWGGVYTEKGGNIRQGYLRFNTQQVIDGLNFLKGLSDARIVGIPQAYNESQFGSAPFKRGEIVLTISSSAGVKENLPNNSVDYPFDVSVHPIPYKDVDKKFVISQGTNLALFRRGTKAEQEAAWELLRYLTVDRNAEFSKNTGYFPVSESAQGSELYTTFLNGDSANYTPGDRAVQDTAILNNDFYLSTDEAWIKFVDPGFVGSSQIRDEVAFIIGKVFYGDQGRPITAQQAIDAAYSRLSSFVEK